jgi:hypothetical protein
VDFAGIGIDGAAGVLSELLPAARLKEALNKSGVDGTTAAAA